MLWEHTTQPDKPDIPAAVFAALHARGATLVEDGGSHDGALARCKIVDAFAHCFDDAAEFVAHCDGHLLARDRVLLFWDENGAGGVFMEVCDRVVNNRIFRFD